jgi:hypothetical protein
MLLPYIPYTRRAILDTQLKTNAAARTPIVKSGATKKTRTAPASRKTPGSPAEKSNERAFVDHEKREAMIRERAYAYCEARGASCGKELEDWLQAERDVDAALCHGL